MEKMKQHVRDSILKTFIIGLPATRYFILYFCLLN